MPTDLYSLQERLGVETGLGNLEPPMIRALLRNAVPKYNGLVSWSFTVTLEGAGDMQTAMLDRDATDDELEFLMLAAVVMYLDGEMIRWSTGAIKVSNVSGRTDMSGIEFALAKRRKEIMDPKTGQYWQALARVNDRAIMGEVNATDLDETIAGTTPLVP